MGVLLAYLPQSYTQPPSEERTDLLYAQLLWAIYEYPIAHESQTTHPIEVFAR